jgi:hypothetical protein
VKFHSVPSSVLSNRQKGIPKNEIVKVPVLAFSTNLKRPSPVALGFPVDGVSLRIQTFCPELHWYINQESTDNTK